MKLSIITINYNNCVGLKKTIASVISQSCKEFEWIVIDGGSTDGSRELIEQYKNYIAYWCSEPDHGIYHAMNKGIAKAHGEYLQFLNSGDILADVKVVENILPSLKEKDIYLANMYFASKIGVPVVNPVAVEPLGILNTILFGAIMHPASYIKKDCFEKYGYYDENMKICSDWWFFFRSIILNNASVSYCPIIVAIFDETGISTTRPSLGASEKKNVLEQHVALGQLTNFYIDNYEIVKALKSSKITFLLFRFYFFLYRKFLIIK